jgi:hypothetical protein
VFSAELAGEQHQMTLATVVEPPAIRHAEATRVAFAQVIAVGVALGKQRIQPRHAVGVLVGEGGGRRLGATSP